MKKPIVSIEDLRDANHFFMNDNHVKIENIRQLVKKLMQDSETDAMRSQWRHVNAKLLGAMQDLSDLIKFANEQADLFKMTKIKVTIETDIYPKL